MTAAEAFSGDSPRARFFTWTAHLLVPVTAVAFVVRVIGDFAPGGLGWLDSAAGVAFNVVYFVAMCHYLWGGLCVRCMREVPADAAEQAALRRPLLWVWHRLITAGFVWIGLGGAAIAADVLWDAAWVRLGPDLAMLVVASAVWSHHRLRPWCPYCRDWDQDGAHEPSPVPPAGVKQS